LCVSRQALFFVLKVIEKPFFSPTRAEIVAPGFDRSREERSFLPPPSRSQTRIFPFYPLQENNRSDFSRPPVTRGIFHSFPPSPFPLSLFGDMFLSFFFLCWKFPPLFPRTKEEAPSPFFPTPPPFQGGPPPFPLPANGRKLLPFFLQGHKNEQKFSPPFFPLFGRAVHVFPLPPYSRERKWTSPLFKGGG